MSFVGLDSTRRGRCTASILACQQLFDRRRRCSASLFQCATKPRDFALDHTEIDHGTVGWNPAPLLRQDPVGQRLDLTELRLERVRLAAKPLERVPGLQKPIRHGLRALKPFEPCIIKAIINGGLELDIEQGERGVEGHAGDGHDRPEGGCLFRQRPLVAAFSAAGDRKDQTGPKDQMLHA